MKHHQSRRRSVEGNPEKMPINRGNTEVRRGAAGRVKGEKWSAARLHNR
ncbi:MAG: hypothetical protein LBT46_01240 [Planctomycetaceae bacterium]|nr:hypothetical protein [Planctomycetaceae bacterium]